MLKSHTLVDDYQYQSILYELRPVKDLAGKDAIELGAKSVHAACRDLIMREVDNWY